MPKKSTDPLEKFPVGHPRPYVRDGVADISREEQIAILRKAGVPLHQLFEDVLSARAVKRRNYAELKLLAEMLRPTTRTTPETIFIVNPRVLGWTVSEVARSIAAAWRRNASIVSLDTESVIPLNGSAEAMDALAALEQEQKVARYSASLAKARAATKRRRDAKWRRAEAIARPLWEMPSDEMPVHRIVAILTEKGIPYSAPSLYNRLGNREDAQKRKKHEQ